MDRKCYIAFTLRECTTQSGSRRKPNVAINFYPCIRNAKHKSIIIKRCKLTLLTCKSCCLIPNCKNLEVKLKPRTGASRLDLNEFGEGKITQNSLREMIAELSRARSELSGAPWVRKFSNRCIPEILVLRKSSVQGTSVRASTVSCKPGWNFAFQAPARFGGKSHSFPAF